MAELSAHQPDTVMPDLTNFDHVMEFLSGD
jgi:hypothetical protein